MDFGEFSAIMLRPQIAKYSVREIQKAFETVQRQVGHGSRPPAGHVHADVLATAFRNFGANKLDREAARAVCDGLNPGSDGLIDYAAILRFLDPEHIL